MSYTEFSYMLIQAYDFLHLMRDRSCKLQVGGSDQWGNITAGTDLIRRVENKPAFGLTFPLIMSSTGQKLGKTEKGATWLSADRTSPYEFYQYWVNRDDADMDQLLKKFTFLGADEINELLATIERGENRGDVQRKLAYEVTWLVHGKDEADKAVRASQMLFGEAIVGLSDRDLAAIFAEVPSSTAERSRLEEGINVIDLFVEAGLVKSKGEGRRLLEQGGVYVNNERIDALETAVGLQHLASETKIVLRAGKKKYHVVSVA
ncbi:MAG: tyrosine--tRNA ligase [bacterium]